MAKNPEENNTLATSEKLKALAAAMAKIEKDFGKGSIMKMGDQQVEDVDVIPTGSLALNAALGRCRTSCGSGGSSAPRSGRRPSGCCAS